MNYYMSEYHTVAPVDLIFGYINFKNLQLYTIFIFGFNRQSQFLLLFLEIFNHRGMLCLIKTSESLYRVVLILTQDGRTLQGTSIFLLNKCNCLSGI